MLTDYHLHLQPDGPEARDADAARWDAEGGFRSAGWIGRYVDAARARAVDEIAITEHVHRFRDVRDWHPNPWWRAEATEDLAVHCAALAEARDGGLPVLIGIEMDWIPDRVDHIRALLAAHPFDIVLGSVHWLGDLAVDHPDYPCWDSLGPDETWARYLDELAAAAASGLFDVQFALGVRRPHAGVARGAARRGDRRHRRVGGGGGVLIRGPAQAMPRAVPRSGLAGGIPPGGRSRHPVQRRAPSRGRGP